MISSSKPQGTAAKAGRRQEIVAAMMDMVGELGADRVTTRALAKRVGVTEPALYRHFPAGKTEMWQALAAVVAERMQAAWREALAGARPEPMDRLRALVTAQLWVIGTTPAMPAILFSRTLHRDNAALRAAVGEVAGRFHARLEQIVVQGQEQGAIRAGLDPDATAWLLISTIQGTALRWSLSERAFQLEPEGARVLEVALAALRPADAGRGTA